MGTKWAHRMTEVDQATGKGVCAHCGPVDLRYKTVSGEKRPRCANAVLAQRRAAPSYTGWSTMKGPHGLSRPSARERVTGQTCEVCGQAAAVNDHDHNTGDLRGYLCHHCNTGLGLFRDDPELLTAAAAYLRLYTERAAVGDTHCP